MSVAPPAERTRTRRLAIVGNPNCGKSTIFNALTGLRQRVGNYPGVTVEKKVGRCFGSHGEPMELLDLPGSYSLQVRSPDEEVARDVLLGRRADTARPDLVICVVDASNLERNLYLVVQLLEMQLPVVVALNMVDVAEANGIVIDVAALSESLGVPVIPTIASKGVGLVQLKQAVSRENIEVSMNRAPMPSRIEEEVQSLAATLQSTRGTDRSTSIPEAMLFLSVPSDEALTDAVPTPGIREAARAARKRLASEGIDPVSAPVEARYKWISEICAAAARMPGEASASVSDKLDAVLTHRIWGWLSFLAAMAFIFFCIFAVAAYPMEWIDSATTWFGDWVREHMPEGDLRSLIVDGAIAGVGGVVIFLPQILTLFFFLGLLEDSGYMARAAFIMDRFMSRVGLHGKSFIPLLSSFACAIPGIMATRTIENAKDRLVTILVAPLMSCSARLPVYTLLIALLLPPERYGAWTKAGVMLSMYLLGVFTAFGMAWLFKRTLLKSETPMLLLEMPPYRWPSVRTIAVRMWERALIFIRRAGTLILAASIVLWALASYPKSTDSETSSSVALSQSYAGRLGHAIEPIVHPLGYDWKIGIGLIGSFAAREVFVGTMAVIYDVGDADETSEPLLERMAAEKWPDGTPVFTPLVCVGLMVFYVLALQCVSTIAIVRRETNSWRWPLFQIAYLTALAYLGALVVYQGGKLLGFQ